MLADALDPLTCYLSEWCVISDYLNIYEKWVWKLYKVVQIGLGLFVCKQVTVCPGHI
jgi:hypothetical protein